MPFSPKKESSFLKESTFSSPKSLYESTALFVLLRQEAPEISQNKLQQPKQPKQPKQLKTMSFRIFKYNPSTSAFDSLQGLPYFQEFPIFQGLKTLEDIAGVKEFKEFKAFKGFKEFKAFLNIIDFLSYYTNFRALLCADCAIGIKPANLKGHLAKHFTRVSNKERNQVVSKAISIIQLLEVFSLSSSLGTINAFATTYTLRPFLELEVLEDLHKCSFCPLIASNTKYIKKHLRGEHKEELAYVPSRGLESGYKVIAQGQSLEKNKYFFQVKTKDKPKALLAISRGSRIVADKGGEEEDKDKELEEGEDIGEDGLDQASKNYLQGLESKREALFRKANIFLLNKEDLITPLQRKTQYVQFLDTRDLKDLSLLSSAYKENPEDLLDILVYNLQELLYITLERSRYVNSISLQYLNSFQLNVTTNKPFRPLLKSKSRVDYFSFFSCFLAFVYRSFYNSKYKDNKLYNLNKESKGLLVELKHLASVQLEQATTSNLDLKKQFRACTKAYNKKLSNFRLNFFLEPEEGGRERGYDSSSPSSTSTRGPGSAFGIISSSSSSSSSSTTSNSKSSSSASSSNSNSATMLEKIQSIGESDNVLSNTIKQKLSSLLIALFKQQLSLYIFDSPVNSFLACYSIRKDLTLRDSLDLSKAYAKFVYCSQLVVLDYGIV